MRGKLIAVGCSYTHYLYPTWADWIGHTYDVYKNIGLSGSGPHYAYSRLIDYLEDEDWHDELTVMVQWSSLIRHDRRTLLGEWLNGGQIDNNPNFSQEYVEEYFNALDTVNNLNNYINHLILLSKEKGFNLKMCYMLEPWVDSLLGEPSEFSSKLRRNIRRVKNSRYMKSLIQKTKSEYWINPSIESFCMHNPSTVKIKRQYGDTIFVDNHPTPTQHLKYAQHVLKLMNSTDILEYEKYTNRLDEYLSIDGNDLKIEGKLHSKPENLIKMVDNGL